MRVDKDPQKALFQGNAGISRQKHKRLVTKRSRKQTHANHEFCEGNLHI